MRGDLSVLRHFSRALIFAETNSFLQINSICILPNAVLIGCIEIKSLFGKISSMDLGMIAIPIPAATPPNIAW